MKLTVIIPVYNEKYTIIKSIQRVERLSMDKEIIIVDDGSTDGTTEILKNFESTENRDIKIIYHKANRGKGAAIRTALTYVGGDLVAIQDADLEYDPQELAKLIAPIIQGKADVVYGSRFRGMECQRILYFWHMIGNKILCLFSNMLTNLNLSDIETCYKVFKADIIKNIKIKEDRFGFEPEVTAKLAQLGCRFYEVGISYDGRTYSEGKKIGWKDGVQALWCILKYNTIAKLKLREALLEPILRHKRIKAVLGYIQPDTEVLDIGCGKGQLLEKIHPMITYGVGLDRDIIDLKVANLKFIRFKMSGSIPFPDNSFDIATLMAFVEHLEDSQALLREVNRVVKKGGLVILTTPHRKGKWLLELLAKIRLVSRKEIDDHKTYFTIRTLSDKLEKAGFTNVKADKFLLGFNIRALARK